MTIMLTSLKAIVLLVLLLGTFWPNHKNYEASFSFRLLFASFAVLIVENLIRTH